MNKKHFKSVSIILIILFVLVGLATVSATDNQTSETSQVSQYTNNHDTHVSSNDISDNIIKEEEILKNTQKQNISTEDETKTIQKDITSTKKIKEDSEGNNIIYISSSGSGDGSKSNPTSLWDAMNLVQDNGTIILTSNDDNVYYYNNFQINPRTLSNNVSNLFIVGEENANITFNSYGSELFIIEQVNVHFKNINFVNGGNYRYYGSIIAAYSSVTFENCNISEYHGHMKDCSYIRSYIANISLINCNVHDNDFRTSTSLIGNNLYRMMGYSMNDQFIQYTTEPNNVTIINSTFKNNRLDDSSNILFFDSYNNVTVINNTFENNIGENGLIRSFMGQKEIYANNTFLNNNATCLYLGYSVSDVKSNKFINNHATKAPCLMLSETESNITDNIFKNNTADTYGGSIINFANSQNNISNCVFENNKAELGGAIYNLYNNISINNCSFINNSADEGGALYLSHQTFTINNIDSNNTITNCLFVDNDANTGSVLYLGDAQVNLSNNAIIDSTLNRNLVHFCDNSNYTIDNNWWSTNTPNFNVLTEGIIPNTWRIMTFTNTTANNNSTTTLKITLNTLNNGETIKNKLPTRKLILYSNDGDFNKNNININSQTSVTYTGSDNKPVAAIDNQQVVLNEKKEAFLNVNNIKARNNQTVNIIVTSSKDLSDYLTIKVNDNVIQKCKTDGSVNIEYAIDDSFPSGNYSITVEYPGDANYYPVVATAILEVYNTKNSKYNNIITPLTQNNFTTTTNLPSRYDPRTLNLTTPLKDQGDSGSCWVFAAIGTLESNIKKSSNVTYDFSENHAKNIISKYSMIGNKYQIPNIGGRAEEIIPYLVGWYGPVNESDDPYVYYSTFSPGYNSSYHVQDVIFIPNRQNITDYEKIKEAIYNYGAVQVAYVAGGTVTNIYNYENYQDNHAATFVGWDDDYDRNNFAITFGDETIMPEGDGAFIIKNSWGGGFADDGYQYISYYDVTYGGYNDTEYRLLPMYTFMLNNTPSYNSIYQYDGISEDLYYIEGEAGIKNVYTAQNDETLAAVGTYFADKSEYQLSIYINDKKVHEQEDTVNLTGYRTIQLTKYFQLYKDDEFTIEMKIKSLTDDYTTIYYQSAYYYPEFNKVNVSFMSFDGKSWTDMAEFSKSAVVLKAYTLETPQIETKSEIKDNILTVTTNVMKNYENATISYKLNNKTLNNANNNKIIYEIVNDTTVHFSINIENISSRDILTTIFTSDDYIVESENVLPKETLLIIDSIPTTKVGDNITIQGTLKSIDNKTISSENIIITLNNKDITVKTDENGQFTYKTTANTIGTNNITITYMGNEKYYASNVTSTFKVKQASMIKYAYLGNVKYGTTVKIVGRLVYNDTNAIKYVSVDVTVNGKVYKLKTDGAGYVRLNYTVDSYDVQKITFKYAGSSRYSSCKNSTSFKVKQPVWIKMASMSSVKYGSTVQLVGRLLYNNTNALKYVPVVVKINDKSYEAKSDGAGYVKLNYTVDSYDVQKVTFKYAGSNIYLACSNSTSFKVKQATWIKMSSLSNAKYGSTVKIVGKLMDKDDNIIKYVPVEIKVNDKTYQTKTNGAGYFNINHTVNSYDVQKVTFKFAGNDIYQASTNSTSFKVKQPTWIKMGSLTNAKYGSTVNMVGRLLNGSSAVKYTDVTVTVNDKTYQTKTNGAGYFYVNHTITSYDIQKVTFKFAGNDIYQASTNSTSFKVK